MSPRSPGVSAPRFPRKNIPESMRLEEISGMEIDAKVELMQGFRHLPLLRHALQVELNLVPNQNQKLA